jgi:hypothetical protein
MLRVGFCMMWTEALGFRPNFPGILTPRSRQPSENSSARRTFTVGLLKLFPTSHGNFKTYRGWQQQRTGEKKHFRPRNRSNETETSESSRREKGALATTSGRDEPQLSPRVASTSPPPYARHARGLTFHHLPAVFMFQSILISSM